MPHDLLSKHRNFPGWRHTTATRTLAIDKLRRSVCVSVNLLNGGWTVCRKQTDFPHDVCRKLCHLSTVTRLWDGWSNIRGSILCRVKTDISFSELSDRLWVQSRILIPTQDNVKHLTGTPEDGRWRVTCTNKTPRGFLFCSLLVNCPRHFRVKCIHTDSPFAFSAWCLVIYQQSCNLPHTMNCTFCVLCDNS